MTLFKNAVMTTFYANRVMDTEKCQVTIALGSIVVSYGKNNHSEYRGREVEIGHYKLTSQEPAGRANLHRFADDEILVGSWVQDRNEGMWMIDLNSEE